MCLSLCVCLCVLAVAVSVCMLVLQWEIWLMGSQSVALGEVRGAFLRGEICLNALAEPSPQKAHTPTATLMHVYVIRCLHHI